MRSLLLAHLDTYAKLHLVLFLHKRRERAWTRTVMALCLELEEQEIELALRELCAGRVVCQRGAAQSYQFAPAETAVADAVDELARVYEEDPLPVLRLLNDRALVDLRSTVRSFNRSTPRSTRAAGSRKGDE